MKTKWLRLFLLILVFASPACAEEGEGGGEDHWIDRYFYHYEYIPYVNGSDFPRLVYRSVSQLGEQSIVASIGETQFDVNKWAAKPSSRSTRRQSADMFDMRRLYRSDVFIFCDLETKYEKTYIIEHYPYRDHHFHYYYYEVPRAVAGFGAEGSPGTGYDRLDRIYIDRNILAKYVSDFVPTMLAPWAAQFQNEPKGQRTALRQWTKGFNETHTSYVWKLDYDKTMFGWYHSFDPETLSAVDSSNEQESFFRNQKAIDDAMAGLKAEADKAKGGSPVAYPTWIQKALLADISIAPETLTTYLFPVKSATRSRDVFRMDPAVLDRYFPDIGTVLNIWSEPGRIMSQAVLQKGKGSYPFGTFTGEKILPPWGTIPYDHAFTSANGTWIVFDKSGDKFSFQYHTDDMSVLAHWLYGDANRTLLARHNIGTGSLLDADNDRERFDNVIKAVSGTGGDLSKPTVQKAVYNGMASSGATMVNVIEDAKKKVARNRWSDSFVPNNPSSPWSKLKDVFPGLYNAVVPWSSPSMGLTFLDVDNKQIGWKRGWRMEIEPTVIDSATYDFGLNPITAQVTHMNELSGAIPPSYEDGERFTSANMKKEAKGWNMQTAFTNRTYDNTATIRTGVGNFFPVDVSYAETLRNAFSGAFGYEIIGAGEYEACYQHLFGTEGTIAGTAKIGAGKYEKGAQEVFKQPAEPWLSSWGMAGERPLGHLEHIGRDSFGFGTNLNLWAPPHKD